MSGEGKSIVVGITGASGSIYAQRLIDLLEQSSCQVHVVMSEPGIQVFGHELGIHKPTVNNILGRDSDNVKIHSNSNLFSQIASGSFPIDAMVVCPCSTHTMSSMAAGLADTLLLRSAYVTLKERRTMVVVTRESPITTIDIENMLRLSQNGAIMCPAAPGFYLEPKTIDDLVDFVVARILDILKIKHDFKRWGC